MKILFTDLLYQRGNRHVDYCMIKLLAASNEVYILMDDNYLNPELEKISNITLLENPYNKCIENPIHNAIVILKRMKLTARYERRIRPDVILFSTYETRLFPIGLHFFKDYNKIVVIENYNIDYLSFKSNRLAYKLFASRINHLVFEPLFRDYLLSYYHLPDNKVHVVPHIQYRKEVNEFLTIEPDSKDFDCIAISGSNDIQMVKEIISQESENQFFTRNRIRCMIKCSGLEFESDYLKVTNGFIPTEKYEELYSRTKVVLVPFPLTYQYRMSGCIVDAFSHHKPVVSSNIKLAEYYASLYGSSIRTGKNVKEMLDYVKYILDNYQSLYFAFDKFEFDHSESEVKKSLSVMVNKMIKN